MVRVKYHRIRKMSVVSIPDDILLVGHDELDEVSLSSIYTLKYSNDFD